ncbi:hypothetical protein ACQPZK_20045 [Micromonospora sp. CA-249363]|jgi:hypothetical protein|uniref:hypothetical protein n=1 Tax=Micromonospora sp. CA-249363 TaxID=3239963 RepID=UPI003D8E08EB
MRGLADRLLALIVPAAPVAAACSTSTYCADCPAPRQAYGRKATRTCCQNEGCTTSYSACYTC